MVRMAFEAGVSLDWLAAGERFREFTDIEAIGDGSHYAIEAKSRSGRPVSQEFSAVPLYDLEVAAGAGRQLRDEHVVDWFAFKESWVRQVLGTTPANLGLVTAVGDSMEPTIRHGDVILVDRGVDQVHDDAIYVIEQWGQLKVKRLHRAAKGSVTIRSDNPAYPEERLEPGELDLLHVAGRVRMISRMT